MNKTIIHGMAKTKFYQLWASMKTRCYNTNSPAYKYYGGKGIKVCKKWLKFKGFYNDMFATHKDGLFLDRINGNRNYTKNNCRWVTVKESNRNKSDNLYITINGITKLPRDWANEYNISVHTLYQRIAYKWPVSDLSSPPRTFYGNKYGNHLPNPNKNK